MYSTRVPIHPIRPKYVGLTYLTFVILSLLATSRNLTLRRHA